MILHVIRMAVFFALGQVDVLERSSIKVLQLLLVLKGWQHIHHG